MATNTQTKPTQQPVQFDLGQFLQSIGQSIGRASGMVGPNQNVDLNQLATPPPMQSLTEVLKQNMALEAAQSELKKRVSEEAKQLPTESLLNHVASNQNATPGGGSTPQVSGANNQPSGDSAQQANPSMNPTITQQNPTGILSALLGMGGVQYDQATNNYTMGNVGILPALLTGFSGKSAQQFQMDKVGQLQKMTGKEAIQPQEQMEMKARMFSAQREAVQGEITAANDQLKSSIDQLTAVGKLPMNVRWGKEKTVLKNIDAASKNLKKSLDRMKSLSTGQKEQSIPKGATHYSPSQNKFYDSKGNEVK